LISALEELRTLGIQFASYTENLDFSTPAGRALANLIGVFAEFERDLIRERVKAGMRNAKDKGTRLGRRPLIDTELLKTIADIKSRGEKKSVRQVAKTLGLSKSLVHKCLKILRQETLENQGVKNEK
jgi:DNA invertase Pin-like site-specific DNA recombinase